MVTVTITITITIITITSGHSLTPYHANI